MRTQFFTLFSLHFSLFSHSMRCLAWKARFPRRGQWAQGARGQGRLDSYMSRRGPGLAVSALAPRTLSLTWPCSMALLRFCYVIVLCFISFKILFTYCWVSHRAIHLLIRQDQNLINRAVYWNSVFRTLNTHTHHHPIPNTVSPHEHHE